MNKNDFYKLRKNIVLNSLFLKDYTNNFYIKPQTVCAFFDSAIDYINNEYKELNGCDIDITKITAKMLYDYYKSMDYDPLPHDNFIAVLNFSAFNGLCIYDVVYDIDDYIIMSYFYHSDISGLITSKPRQYKIYNDDIGDAYIIYKKQRYYINDFMKVD